VSVEPAVAAAAHDVLSALAAATVQDARRSVWP